MIESTPKPSILSVCTDVSFNPSTGESVAHLGIYDPRAHQAEHSDRPVFSGKVEIKGTGPYPRTFVPGMAYEVMMSATTQSREGRPLLQCKLVSLGDGEVVSASYTHRTGEFDNVVLQIDLTLAGHKNELPGYECGATYALRLWPTGTYRRTMPVEEESVEDRAGLFAVVEGGVAQYIVKSVGPEEAKGFLRSWLMEQDATDFHAPQDYRVKRRVPDDELVVVCFEGSMDPVALTAEQWAEVHSFSRHKIISCSEW